MVGVDANAAYVMSSGEGAKSRIYKTGDGGKTWQVPPGGYRSAVGEFAGGYVAVGPSGTEINGDGLRWEHTDVVGLNAVGLMIGQVWAVGPKGLVARFVDRRQYWIENVGDRRSVRGDSR